MIRKSTKLLREGRYAADVEVELRYSDENWSPTLSVADAQKLEMVTVALKRGDVAEAAKYARVFELTPVAAE